MLNKYVFYGLDINRDVKVKVETDTLYKQETAWSMCFRLGQMFPELQFEYES